MPTFSRLLTAVVSRKRAALFGVLAAASLSLAAPLHAQVCAGDLPTLSVAQLPKEKQVDARSPSKFLAGGSEGALLLRTAPGQSNPVARIFANSRALPLLSVRPAPAKNTEPGFIEGFLPADNILVSFRTPRSDAFPLWHKQDFLVVACRGGELAAWGMVHAVVTNREIVIGVSLALMAILYVLFALAVWWVRRRDNPLQTKYPGFASIRQFAWYEYLWNPVHLTANAFDQASVQKLQILLFSFLVGGMLLSYVLETGNLSDLSVTVATLLGISGVGTAVSQATNQQRERLDFANWTWLVRKNVLPIHQTKAEGPSWGDLVLTAREFDIYKFQNLLFSIVVAVALLVSGEGQLARFEIPNTLLGILGLSQVVYLAGVLVRPPSIGELDSAVTKLRQLQATLSHAIADGTDVDDKGELIKPPPTPAPAAAPHASRNYDEQANQVMVMLEAILEVTIDRNKLNP